MSRYRSSYHSSNNDVVGNCLYYLVILIVMVGISYVLDGYAVTYIANVVFHHTIEFWQAAVIGLLSGDLVLPAFVIVWFLDLMGVF